MRAGAGERRHGTEAHALAKARQAEVDEVEYAYWKTLTDAERARYYEAAVYEVRSASMQEARFGVIVAGTRGRQAGLIDAVAQAYIDSPMQRALRKAEAAAKSAATKARARALWDAGYVEVNDELFELAELSERHRAMFEPERPG